MFVCSNGHSRLDIIFDSDSHIDHTHALLHGDTLDEEAFVLYTSPINSVLFMNTKMDL